MSDPELEARWTQVVRNALQWTTGRDLEMEPLTPRQIEWIAGYLGALIPKATV